MTRKNYHRAIKTYILWLLIILLIVLPAEAKKRSKSDKASQSSQSYSVQSKPREVYNRARPEANGEVMIAPTGFKYHVPNGCRTVRGERKIISRNQAIQLGYSSCGVCHPDVFLMNSSTTPAPQTQKSPADKNQNYRIKSNERQNIQSPKVNNINKEGQEWVKKNVFPGMAWNSSDMTKRFGEFEKYSLKNSNPDSVQAFYFKNIDMTFKIDIQKEIITGWSLGRVYE